MIVTSRVDKHLLILIKDSVIMNDDALYEEVGNAISGSEIRRVKIDMGEMERIDDHGVDILYRLIQKFTQRGYNIRIQHPNLYLLKLLVVKGLIDKINIDYEPSELQKYS
ncbi:MAG: STAS domain-containing protein [Spirochaetes bacterium]|nr:MAG: STAS domain-containing protein [Spirochaetota bacterium]